MAKRAPRFFWRRVGPNRWEIEPHDLSPLDEGNKEAGIELHNGTDFHWYVQIWVDGPGGGLPINEGSSGTSSTYELAAGSVRKKLKAKPSEFAYYRNISRGTSYKFALTNAVGVASPEAKPKKPAKLRGAKNRRPAAKDKAKAKKKIGSVWSRVSSYLRAK
jgi:hypothetical protein